MKTLKKWFSFLWLILGNIIQVFIVLVFVDFLCRKFNEWLVDFYVLTNCNYNSFYDMFLLLIISLLTVLFIALSRYIWFIKRYLKRISNQRGERGVRKNHVTKN